MKDREIIESRTVEHFEAHCVNFIELKDGEKCLRLADSVTAIENGKFLIESKWLRPVGQSWDPLLYEDRTA